MRSSSTSKFCCRVTVIVNFIVCVVESIYHERFIILCMLLIKEKMYLGYKFLLVFNMDFESVYSVHPLHQLHQVLTSN